MGACDFFGALLSIPFGHHGSGSNSDSVGPSDSNHYFLIDACQFWPLQLASLVTLLGVFDGHYDILFPTLVLLPQTQNQLFSVLFGVE